MPRATLERPPVHAPAPVPPSRVPEFRHAGGLDGIRALAVAAVVLYHIGTTGGWAGFPGGFIGVDIFFVLSGYLITSLLVVEFRQRQKISIGRFYLRRARRLLPALFALLLTVGLVGAFALPGLAARLRGDLVAAFGYVTNWWLIVQNSSYFGTPGDRPDLLTHLWSLAVEEQYYLIWPLVLILFALFRASRRTMVTVIMIAVLASTIEAAILYDPFADPSRIYYGTDTRAVAPLLGSALAIAVRPWLHRTTLPALRRIGLELIGLAGLAGLVLLGLKLHDNGSFSPTSGFAYLYYGGFLAIAALAALVVGAAGHPASLLGRLLGLAPLRWLGDRSYAIYLWHWPACVLTRPGVDLPLTGWANTVLRVVIVIALAEASYWLIERPIRQSGFLGRLRRATAPGAPATPVVAVVSAPTSSILSTTSTLAVPILEEQIPGTPRVPAPRSADPAGVYYGQRRRRSNRPALARLAVLSVLLLGGGSLAALQLAHDVATVPVTGGPVDNAPDVALGPLGTPGATPTATPSAAATERPLVPVPPGAKVAFFGDSQGMTLLLNKPPDLAKYINASDQTIEGCGVLLGKVVSRTGEKRNLTDGCRNWESTWASRAAKVKPDVAVVMIGAWDVFDLTLDSGTLTFGSAQWDANFLSQLDKGLRALRANSGEVALSLLPCYRPVSRSAGFWPERGDDTRTRHVNELLHQEATRNADQVHTIEPPADFCTNPAIGKSLSYRWDGVHYYKAGAALYFKDVLPQLIQL